MNQKTGKILTIVLAICFVSLAIFGITGIVNGFGGANYQANKAIGNLWNARSTDNLTEIGNFYTVAINDIKDLHGNPKWFFPTPDFDWDMLKKRMKDNAEAAYKMSVSNNSFAIQQFLTNNQKYIDEIVEHIADARDWQVWWTQSALLQWFIDPILGFVMVICYIKYKD